MAPSTSRCRYVVFGFEVKPRRAFGPTHSSGPRVPAAVVRGLRGERFLAGTNGRD